MRQNSFSSCTSFAPFAPFLLSNDVDGKDGVGKQIDPHTQKGRVPGVLETLNLKKKKEKNVEELYFTKMANDCAAKISLVMQFIASFCWAVGAILAGPMNSADFLQLSAAMAWCVANFASAWSMKGGGCRGEKVAAPVFCDGIDDDLASTPPSCSHTSRLKL